MHINNLGQTKIYTVYNEHWTTYQHEIPDYSPFFLCFLCYFFVWKNMTHTS